VVQDYDPEGPHVFEELRASIWAVASDVAITIEHVGSTAVEGLAAKPIIDMDVVVAQDDVAAGIVRLVELGYEHRGDLGIAGREAFRSPAGSPRHHLYLCPSGNEALANHLAIRDYLRANPRAASAYGALKKRLAREFPNDIDGYVDGKTGFLVGVLRAIGFDEGVLQDMQRVNRRPEV